MKVPKFAGDPHEWLNFSASFFATIHRASEDNVYRLTMLRESLSPKVRQTVEQYLYNPLGPLGVGFSMGPHRSEWISWPVLFALFRPVGTVDLWCFPYAQLAQG